MSLHERFRIGQIVTFDGKRARVAKFSPGGNYVHIVPLQHADGTAQSLVYATALSESEARKRVLVDGEDPAIVQMTAAQRELYNAITSGAVFVVTNKQMRVASALARLGLVTIEKQKRRTVVRLRDDSSNRDMS